MDPTTILAAGVASGTILLFAAIGEIFAERSGVLNLGVEGMMLIGAVAGFSVAMSTGNPWVGVAAAMLAGGLLSLIHGVMTIHLRADQVVSGLALTFLGTGLARVLGEGLSSASQVAQLPRLTIPVLSDIPVVGPVLFTDQSVLVYVGYVLVPSVWLWIGRTRPGLHLRAVGEAPSQPTPRGSASIERATPMSSSADCWPGLPARPFPSPSTRAGSAIRPSTDAAGSPSAWSSSPSGVP
jgi:simple sugar transport system permease protein